MAWQKNGELLGLAELNGFNLFVTIDKNLKHQQSIYKFNLKFIILLAVDNKHQTLQPYINRVKSLLTGGDIPKVSEISFLS